MLKSKLEKYSATARLSINPVVYSEVSIGAKSISRRKIMRKEYDFSKIKGRKNPYAKKLKKQVTIRMGIDIIEYFKRMSEDTGIPYQNLINLYLRDCVQSGRKISIKWAS
jgi:uncharacterized protein (DUF4415 family)